jgi:hypothetical protein
MMQMHLAGKALLLQHPLPLPLPLSLRHWYWLHRLQLHWLHRPKGLQHG